MTATISRDELKQKMDRGDNFILVETLAALPEKRETDNRVNTPQT